jgi:hypothetical protein
VFGNHSILKIAASSPVDIVVAQSTHFGVGCDTCAGPDGAAWFIDTWISRILRRPNTKLYLDFPPGTLVGNRRPPNKHLILHDLIKTYQTKYRAVFGGLELWTPCFPARVPSCPAPSDVFYEYRRALTGAAAGTPWDPNCPAPVPHDTSRCPYPTSP